ncbi:cation:proton antiporter, partial [Streptomyces sp. T-3]|nr:cation:proton antiporter [Streptomyces sp. T-3]
MPASLADVFGAGAVRLAADGPALGLDLPTRFLLGLACLLLLTHGAGLVARRVGQPAILAELTVGLLLGPSLAGALWPQGHALLFGPEVLPLLDGLAQLGLVLLALQIGRLLAAPLPGGSLRGATVATVSAFSFFVPLAAGIVLGAGIGGQYAGALDSSAGRALFLGCALSITALPVLARLLQDEGLTETPVGRISLAAAAVGDAAAWCVLTVALVMAGAVSVLRLVPVAVGAVLV